MLGQMRTALPEPMLGGRRGVAMRRVTPTPVSMSSTASYLTDSTRLSSQLSSPLPDLEMVDIVSRLQASWP